MTNATRHVPSHFSNRQEGLPLPSLDLLLHYPTIGHRREEGSVCKEYIKQVQPTMYATGETWALLKNNNTLGLLRTTRSLTPAKSLMPTVKPAFV
ncbi:MAG: hypothetical protein GY782_02245 [Gammaproteobacteria bacterium]|nr:hypothetical protein [Gammaproteobacteria bacterium]